MHADEIFINDALVKKLVQDQFPKWSHLALKRFQSSGTDNAIYRLGEKMSVRLPLTMSAAGRIDKEFKWLPKLSSLLPMTISQPIAKGIASTEYPADWSIYPWIEGETASIEKIKDPQQVARELAQFIAALEKISFQHEQGLEELAPGPHNFFRGEPLAKRDAETREAIKELAQLSLVDAKKATYAWEEALSAPAWPKRPVWIHGDLLPSNLLLNENGELSAVIDFGGMGLGDPACDLITPWCLFDTKTRAYFRQQLPTDVIDEAAWTRGKGWALSIGLIALPYYRTSNPLFAKVAKYMIEEVLHDLTW